MTDTVGSALLRRYIGRRFETLRTKAGLTQDQVSKALDRARATIGRIEEGHEAVRYREIDVKAMLDLYKAPERDYELMLALTAETRNGKRKSWWHDYTETALPAWFGLYVTLEDSAKTIRQYQPELVPGLLQTRAYAEQVIRVPEGHLAEEEVNRRVKVRIERQSLLTRLPAPTLQVILNEAVIRRPVGGPQVMAEQFDHLLDLAKNKNVSVRVLPFAAGVHGGMSANGPFSLLAFPDDRTTGEPFEPPLAYAESLTSALYLNKPDEVGVYELAWNDLEAHALDDKESVALITATQEGNTRG